MQRHKSCGIKAGGGGLRVEGRVKWSQKFWVGRFLKAFPQVCMRSWVLLEVFSIFVAHLQAVLGQEKCQRLRTGSWGWWRRAGPSRRGCRTGSCFVLVAFQGWLCWTQLRAAGIMSLLQRAAHLRRRKPRRLVLWFTRTSRHVVFLKGTDLSSGGFH